MVSTPEERDDKEPGYSAWLDLPLSTREPMTAKDANTARKALQALDTLTQAAPIALGVIHQLLFFRDPHRLVTALLETVEDDACDLAALADARAVPNEEPATDGRLALCGRQGALMRLPRVDHGLELRDRQPALCHDLWRECR